MKTKELKKLIKKAIVAEFVDAGHSIIPWVDVKSKKFDNYRTTLSVRLSIDDAIHSIVVHRRHNYVEGIEAFAKSIFLITHETMGTDANL